MRVLTPVIKSEWLSLTNYRVNNHLIMAETNEQEAVVEVEEAEEAPEAPEAPTDDPAALKARLQRLEEKAITQRERTRSLKAELQKAKQRIEAPKEEPRSKPGELDETQLDYLDLKGITEPEDIAVIQRIVLRTGATVREALKDDYVISKLNTNKAEREVKAAIPSSTKRAGSQVTNLDALIAKAERSGELPDDYELRSQVVDALASKDNPNKPRWQR